MAITEVRTDEKPIRKDILCVSIRDFTHSLATILAHGGECVLYKGREPYRYIAIRPIKLVKRIEGGLTRNEINEREKTHQEATEEKVLESDGA